MTCDACLFGDLSGLCSITAEAVARSSAIPARTTPCHCPRQLSLCECATGVRLFSYSVTPRPEMGTVGASVGVFFVAILRFILSCSRLLSPLVEGQTILTLASLSRRWSKHACIKLQSSSSLYLSDRVTCLLKHDCLTVHLVILVPSFGLCSLFIPSDNEDR